MNVFRRRRYEQLGVVSGDTIDATTISHPRSPVPLFGPTAADRLRNRSTPTTQPEGEPT